MNFESDFQLVRMPNTGHNNNAVVYLNVTSGYSIDIITVHGIWGRLVFQLPQKLSSENNN